MTTPASTNTYNATGSDPNQPGRTTANTKTTLIGIPIGILVGTRRFMEENPFIVRCSNMDCNKEFRLPLKNWEVNLNALLSPNAVGINVANLPNVHLCASCDPIANSIPRRRIKMDPNAALLSAFILAMTKMDDPAIPSRGGTATNNMDVESGTNAESPSGNRLKL